MRVCVRVGACGCVCVVVCKMERKREDNDCVATGLFSLMSQCRLIRVLKATLCAIKLTG